MSTMSVSGLASGIDTAALVSQLMQAEAAPQTALKSKLTAAQSVVTAYQSVNSKFAALQTAAEHFAKRSLSGTFSEGPAWKAPTGTSSSTGVSVSTLSSGSPGTVTFDVTSVASAQTEVTDAEAPQPSTSAGRSFSVSVTSQAADGTTSTRQQPLTSANGDLASVAAAINDAKLGVTAVALNVGGGQYRLQVTHDKSGSGNTFALDGLGTTTRLRPAQDAVLDLGGGVAVTSPSNTFSGVLDGTSFTVSKVEPAVMVTATADPKVIADQVKGMVDAANAVLSEIGRQTAYDATTKKGQPLFSDSTVRALAQSLTARVIAPDATYGSPIGAGIQLDRSGKLTFDRDAFLKTYAADPTKAQALVDGVAKQLVTTANEATASTTGVLTKAVQGRNEQIKDMNKRIDDWDVRLASRRTALQRQFTAMETALSSMQQQSSWLSGQIASLPSY